MKKKPVKNTHGGAGRGQGKKPIPADQKRVTKAITVSVEFAEWMDSMAKTKEHPENRGASVVLEEIGRKSRAFKSWQLAKTT